jgi:hypothetical protein
MRRRSFDMILSFAGNRLTGPWRGMPTGTHEITLRNPRKRAVEAKLICKVLQMESE